MLYNSYAFLLFFPLVLILVGLIPVRWKNPALLFVSYYFYSCFSHVAASEIQLSHSFCMCCPSAEAVSLLPSARPC